MFNPPTYPERIVGMMKDYEISLFDAVLWDFESSLDTKYKDANDLFWKLGKKALEQKFNQYLSDSGLNEKDHPFYTDIFMGRSKNMGLKSVEAKK